MVKYFAARSMTWVHGLVVDLAVFTAGLDLRDLFQLKLFYSSSTCAVTYFFFGHPTFITYWEGKV